MTYRTISASWLTARRVQVHGLLLAVSLWTVYAFNLSTPGLIDRNGLIKGTDFLHFYILGTLALHGRGDLLYDMRSQAELISRIVPQAAGYSYVALYGPQVSLLFAPFASISYGWALVVWLLLNAAIYGACCCSIWRTCPRLREHRWTVCILALAFPGFFHLLAWGQTSGLALLWFTLAYLALRAERRFLAGVAIGCLIFKPQLGLAAAVIFLVTRQWKVVLGAVISAVAQLSVGWVVYGTTVMQDYLRALLDITDVMQLLEPRPYQMHSLRAFWNLLIPWSAAAFVLYVASAVAVLTLALWCWRQRGLLEIRYTTLLLATVLAAPHLTVYDLVILAPAFLLLGDWAMSGAQPAPAVQVLLYLCYPLFLLGPLARVSHLQASVVVLAALMWLCCRMVSGGERAQVGLGRI